MKPVPYLQTCCTMCLSSCFYISSGAELHEGLALSQEVEDHCPGLHLFPSCWEHEEEESDRLQHGGSRDRVRPPAFHSGQLFPQAAPHGCQLQETTHQPRWCQQYIPQQVVSFPSILYIFIRQKHTPSDLSPDFYVCSETIMFLHEIFHQGLKARIANWPTLVLGEYSIEMCTNVL